MFSSDTELSGSYPVPIISSRRLNIGISEEGIWKLQKRKDCGGSTNRSQADLSAGLGSGYGGLAVVCGLKEVGTSGLACLVRDICAEAEEVARSSGSGALSSLCKK